MSVGLLINQSYKQTCAVCDWMSKALLAVLMGSIAITESVGRARAAAELSRMGYHAEAKRLMLESKENE